MKTGRQRVLLSWSSGKDCAWALHVLRRDADVEVCGLLTTVNAVHRRVAMHGVRVGLLTAQAEAVGVPLEIVELPHPCSNAEYESRVAESLVRARQSGITGVAFGDLFLVDVRTYRERQLATAGLAAHFPLWQCDTKSLARTMLRSGVRARVVCVDPSRCPADLAGAEFDAAFLDRLPGHVDPCGENGEFHTFACDGPAFTHPIDVDVGEIVHRDDLVFADLTAAGAGAS
jgi:uncharacterized protein (TIGR00290 family)